MTGVFVYLRDGGWTPLGVAVWVYPAGVPRDIISVQSVDTVLAKAQGRAVVFPSGNLYHVVAVWWGIGGAAGVPWEVFEAYAQPIHQAMSGYDAAYYEQPLLWFGSDRDSVNLWPDAWEVDAAAGQASDPHNPNLPAPGKSY